MKQTIDSSTEQTNKKEGARRQTHTQGNNKNNKESREKTQVSKNTHTTVQKLHKNNINRK
jgi:hypothetical protein